MLRLVERSCRAEATTFADLRAARALLDGAANNARS